MMNGYQFLWTNFADLWQRWLYYIDGLKTFTVTAYVEGYEEGSVLLLWFQYGDTVCKVIPAYDRETGLHFTNTSGET